MLRNNERHMVMLQLLTRIIIAGIDYMPFWAVNGVNHERTTIQYVLNWMRH